MSCILIVEKNGTIKELKIKSINPDDYYKKAGFKSHQNFEIHHDYNIVVNDIAYSISLYGKTKGKANQENKYEFPPPVDKLLFFGNCLLVKNDMNKTQQPLLANEWEKIYETLLGGLEDIGSEDSEDDYDDIEPALLTKSGYMKDEFIVDDGVAEKEYEEEDEDNEDEEEDDDEDEDDDDDDDIDDNSIEDEYVSKLSKKKKLKNALLKSKKIKIINAIKLTKKRNNDTDKIKNNNKKELVSDENRLYLDCSSELSAEDYFTKN